MALAVDGDEINETFVHKFRFADTDQVLSFTQEQLERIPYLNALVSNADNFSCSRSEDNAFILNSQIQYTLFNVIQSAIVHQKPAHLFTKLPRDVDVFCMLELYDYLCIDPLPVPSLKPISEIKKENRILFYEQYYEATPSEARDTAVEFLVAIINRKYDFNSRNTVKIVFDLLIDILTSVSVFDHRLRYQTLVVIESCCADLFTPQQQDLLRAYERSLETLNNSNSDLDDENQILEAPETHFFRWRKQSCSITCKNMFSSSSSSKKRILLSSPLDDLLFTRLYPPGYIFRLLLYDYPWADVQSLCARCYERYQRRDDILHIWRFRREISCNCGYLNDWIKVNWNMYIERGGFGCIFSYDYSCQLANMDFQLARCLINCCSKPKKVKKTRETRFLYSGRAHYLLNALSVDKFKNRSSIKGLKYR